MNTDPDPRIEAMMEVWFDDGWAQTINVSAEVAADLLAAADAVDAVRVTLAKIRELHRPHDVKHQIRALGPDEARRLSDADFRRSLADEPYEIRQHCSTCACGKDDWPCATAALLDGNHDH